MSDRFGGWMNGWLMGDDISVGWMNGDDGWMSVRVGGLGHWWYHLVLARFGSAKYLMGLVHAMRSNGPLPQVNFWLAIKYIIHNNLPMCWEQFAKTKANRASMEQPEEVADSEGPGQINTAEVEAAREWLDIDDGPEASKNILKIVKSCLKGMKRPKTGCSIKLLTQLTAITEYAKLCTRF